MPIANSREAYGLLVNYVRRLLNSMNLPAAVAAFDEALPAFNRQESAVVQEFTFLMRWITTLEESAARAGAAARGSSDHADGLIGVAGLFVGPMAGDADADFEEDLAMAAEEGVDPPMLPGLDEDLGNLDFLQLW